MSLTAEEALKLSNACPALKRVNLGKLIQDFQDTTDLAGAVTDGEALGTGEAIYKQKTAGKIQMKGIKVDANHTIVADATSLTISHPSDEVGFFGTNPMAQVEVEDLDTWEAISDGEDSVDLADLNTKVKAINDKLQQLIDALHTYGLIGSDVE